MKHLRLDVDVWSKVPDSLTAEIAVLDRDGVIVAVNDAWVQFAEENSGDSETIGVGVNYLDICRGATGEDALLAERACRGIEQVIDGSRDVFQLEYPCHCKNEQRWFLLYVSRLKNESDYVVTTHVGITDRKRTEQRLVESERLAAIGEAMRGLSHEGRNALQRAQSCMELLRLQIDGDHEAVELLDRIERAQSHLLDLYEEVRRYASPIHLSYRRYPLNRLAEEAWSTIDAKGNCQPLITWTNDLDLNCEVDLDSIRKVFRLLFENALATNVKPLKMEVTFAAAKHRGHPAITAIISDNGPGRTLEDQDRPFMPFYTTKTHGTGLGLAICKRIALAHAGTIRFGPSRLGGASVHFTLPKRRPH
jgi:signal transduction histidine kinase